MLVTQKQRVEELQKRVKEAKNAYAASLRTLEEISNQIHERRRDYGKNTTVLVVIESINQLIRCK